MLHLVRVGVSWSSHPSREELHNVIIIQIMRSMVHSDYIIYLWLDRQYNGARLRMEQAKLVSDQDSVERYWDEKEESF